MLTRTAQMFYRETIVWKFLQHPNVLPLRGVLKDRSQFKFAMVSEWMENGNINKFVRTHRSVNRYKLVCFLCSPPRSLVTQDYVIFAVGRCF